MYDVSDAYHAAAEGSSRQILLKALFNGSVELLGDHLIDLTVTEAVNASDGLSMGKTISSKLTMKIKMPDTPLVLSGGFVQPSVGFYGVSTTVSSPEMSSDGILTFSSAPTVTEEGILIGDVLPDINDEGVVIFSGGVETAEYCPLGKFYITDAVSTNDFHALFSITAFDGFCKTETSYVPTIDMPNTAEAILRDIAAQCNFSLASEIQYPPGEYDLFDFTCREYIGYFAGLLGKNARFDRDGNLIFTWYTDYGRSVEREQQFMGGFKRLTSEDFVVQSVTSGSSDHVLVAGTGVGISFDNPFMTQEILNGIFEGLDNLSYTPAQLKWRGDPAVEAGDILVADDKDGNSREIYVMEQTLKISGGMHSEIKCYGSSEAAIHFETSPQAKKIQQAYNKLQEAIKEATEILNGANGGIFEITDEDGNGINDGWIIHSVDGQKFIKANINGIGITTDGGATYAEAMTADGINADVITAGQMNAQRISVGDETLGDVFLVETSDDGHPVVTIGSSKNDIKQRQTNDAITFVDGNDEEVAQFSTTGAEWRDMQQIKYCGFVWSKSAITGNVRFTKGEEKENGITDWQL